MDAWLRNVFFAEVPFSDQHQTSSVKFDIFYFNASSAFPMAKPKKYQGGSKGQQWHMAYPLCQSYWWHKPMLPRGQMAFRAFSLL